METQTGPSDTKTISREQFYALTGLLTLARQHNTALDTIKKAVAEITEEPDGEMGHSADAVYEGYGTDDLLRRLGIEVLDG